MLLHSIAIGIVHFASGIVLV